MKMVLTKILEGILISLFLPVWGYAQIIEVDPVFPVVANPVDITFHVNRCNCNLVGYTGDIYAHTGLITNESADMDDWEFVIADWNENIEKALLQKIDDTTYVLHITPSITEYYEITPEVIVENLAFVFRSSDRSKQTGNIYYQVYEQGLTVQFNEPKGNVVVEPDDTIFISAEAIAIGTNPADSIRLYIDNKPETVSYTDTIYYELIVSEPGKHWIKIEAGNDELTATDSLFYFVRNEVPVADLPAGVTEGINYIDTVTVTLVLYAPYKDNVFLIGDFNEWEFSNEYLMNRTPDEERYWITVTNLTKGEEYAFQYLVDGNLHITDPYTDKILDPVNDDSIPESTYPDLKPYPVGLTEGIVSVFQTGQEEFNWQVTDFEPASITDLVIYELHIRDFVDEHNFKTVMDTLDYLGELGVNAIEFMPVNEFEGNDSWGYNPSFYFAVDKYYGTKNEFKQLIDECHSRGIAVIMDMVLNHSYSQSPLVQLYYEGETGTTTAESPWYNQTCPHEPWCWGFDFNHESEATRTFVNRVNRYWLEEYHIDGYRFDFTKGFTNIVSDGWNYDASRIAILKAMYDSIKSVNPDALVIFEHLTDNSEEKELANYGILLWGKMTDPYNEATMGYHDGGKSNLSGISYQYREWDDPQLVGYMESHDEQRLMYKNLTWGNSSGNYDVKNLHTGLQRVEAAALFFFTVPGPKMVWQFGELGYDIDIDEPCRTCEKPILWEYYDYSYRYHLYKVFSALIKLRIREDLFETTDFSLGVGSAIKRINLNSFGMNAVILGNFDVISGSREGNFPHTGTWYEYFTGNSLELTATNQTIDLQPGEYRMYTDVQLELPDIPTLDIPDNTFTLQPGLLFPNPTDGIIYLKPSSQGNAEFTLYSSMGQPVYAKALFTVPEDIIELDLNNSDYKLKKGIYFYTLQNFDKTMQGKLIIE